MKLNEEKERTKLRAKENFRHYIQSDETCVEITGREPSTSKDPPNETFQHYIHSDEPCVEITGREPSTSKDPLEFSNIQEDVPVAIQSLLDAQNIWEPNRDLASVSLNDETLTPAQRFYLENKQLLLKRAIDYSRQKAENEFDRATQEIEDEWAFYRDPIVRPPRGHLWSVDSEDMNDDQSPVRDFEEGRFPEVDEIVHMLQDEKVNDLKTIDLDLCNRRDIGEWAIIGTVQSAAHGTRVGNLARRAINKLGLEHVRCFLNSIPGQEWVVVRLGPVIVHLMTPQDRSKYNLEEMYASNEPMLEEMEASLIEDQDQSFISR